MLNKVELQFAEVLGVDKNLEDKKARGTIFKRLEYLGYTETCPRCSGSGRYSFNGTHSICYQCNGAKTWIPKKVDNETLNQIKLDVDSGKLNNYFELIRMTKIVNKAVDIVGNAWKDTGISKKYDWTKLTKEGYEEDKRIGKLNEIMYNEYIRIGKLTKEFKNFGLEYSKEKEQYIITLNEEVKKSIEIINETAKLI